MEITTTTPAKLTQIELQQLHLISVQNFPEYMTWYATLFSGVDRILWSQNIKLSSFSKETMKEIFGPQTLVANFTDRNWIWRLSFRNRIFFIFVSNRGISIELQCEEDINKVMKDRSISKDCIAFSENLLEMLNE